MMKTFISNACVWSIVLRILLEVQSLDCISINLLTSFQKPLGLLSLLDEESTFPNGSDLTFANKLKQHLNSNSSFKGERDKAFTVSHYAGEVFNLC